MLGPVWHFHSTIPSSLSSTILPHHQPFILPIPSSSPHLGRDPPNHLWHSLRCSRRLHPPRFFHPPIASRSDLISTLLYVSNRRQILRFIAESRQTWPTQWEANFVGCNELWIILEFVVVWTCESVYVSMCVCMFVCMCAREHEMSRMSRITMLAPISVKSCWCNTSM